MRERRWSCINDVNVIKLVKREKERFSREEQRAVGMVCFKIDGRLRGQDSCDVVGIESVVVRYAGRDAGSSSTSQLESPVLNSANHSRHKLGKPGVCELFLRSLTIQNKLTLYARRGRVSRTLLNKPCQRRSFKGRASRHTEEENKSSKDVCFGPP